MSIQRAAPAVAVQPGATAPNAADAAPTLSGAGEGGAGFAAGCLAGFVAAGLAWAVLGKARLKVSLA